MAVSKGQADRCEEMTPQCVATRKSCTVRKVPKAATSAISFSSSKVSRQELVQSLYFKLCQTTHFNLPGEEEKIFQTGKCAGINYDLKYFGC